MSVEPDDSTQPESDDISPSGPRLLRMDRIKNRIVLVALLATLIPSIGTAWVSYLQNKRALTEKITEELAAGSSQAARELDLWIEQRIFDLRVFTTSYEVSENLQLLPRIRDESTRQRQAFTRLTDYLTSVRDRSPSFRELMVFDTDAELVASSADSIHTPSFSPAGLEIFRNERIFGEPYWDETAGTASMMLAYAIVPDVALMDSIGLLAATLNFEEIEAILTRYTPGDSGEAFLIDATGRLIMSSKGGSAELMQNQLTDETLDALSSGQGTPVEYAGFRGEEVVGVSRMIPKLEWDVVTEVPRAEAFAAVSRLRNTTIMIVAGLLLGVGLIAYRVGVIIVRPLDQLTTGVKQVAAGDFSVDLPVVGGGEVDHRLQRHGIAAAHWA
jgi:hypothetical protein